MIAFRSSGCSRLIAAAYARSAVRAYSSSSSSAPATATASTKVTTTSADRAVVADVSTISGAPLELRGRLVHIFKPAKTAMQSGKHQTRHWRLDFEQQGTINRWENPLMGWPSTADSQTSLRMKFSSKDDAIRFAEAQGWEYIVHEPKQAVVKPKMYIDNFKYSAGPLRIIKTK
ncbi:hypothetical protein GQ42DRAFT_161248 [Ramicandelaber brevisporus]|nr:hypothetical protein GQ42DRAFT_161248 [Ramicandelaber brevisporus]